MIYACENCGCPIDENGNQLEMPEGWNPDKYEKGVCNFCSADYQQENNHYICVTREMAMDAQDMRLEGQLWKWK